MNKIENIKLIGGNNVNKEINGVSDLCVYGNTVTTGPINTCGTLSILGCTNVIRRKKIIRHTTLLKIMPNVTLVRISMWRDSNNLYGCDKILGHMHTLSNDQFISVAINENVSVIIGDFELTFENNVIYKDSVKGVGMVLIEFI